MDFTSGFQMAKKEYTRLNQQESSDESALEGSFSEARIPNLVKTATPFWIFAVISFLVISNVMQLGFLGFFYWDGNKTQEKATPPEYAIGQEIPTEYRRFWWNTAYSSANLTLQDELWDSLLWTHGMIAVDREWAKSKDWPDTMELPGDSRKGVYLLEAYHEIHCLGILRRIMSESLSGVDYGKNSSTYAHVAHCFDYLLQVVTCNADSLPLNTFGGTYVGNGQTHKCKNWEALRNFASESSACYMEIEGVSLDEHFGHCDYGDGLIMELGESKRTV